MRNFIIFGCSLKNPTFRGGRGGEFTKNQYRGGIAVKGGLGQFADLREGERGGLARKRGWDF